jgi:two-component system, NtrC family, sensor kinase
MAQDVSQLQSLKKQWMAMIDAIEDPLSIVDSGFNIQRQNVSYHGSAQQPNSLSIKEFVGKKCYEVFAGRKSPCVECLLHKALQSGESQSWTTKGLVVDQEHEVRIHPMGSGNTAVVHYRNITQFKRLQEGLAQADKLASLGKLTGGVAHELNSPLAGIIAFAQMALREMEESNPHFQDMKEIEYAAQKCKVIVEGMLGFARQENTGESVSFDLKVSLESVLRLAQPALKKAHIDTSLGLPSGKFPYLGNRGKIEQVLMNLVSNAIYAMKGGGTLHLALDPTSRPGWIVVHVEDSGCGIPSDKLPKIFDPFFTTKPFGEGTGLGLSISYSIAKWHGGTLEVESDLGIGTIFRLVLPYSSEQNLPG